MNKIIEEILKNGITLQVNFNKEKNKMIYTVDGFYKSGTVDLEEKEGEDILVATSRYNEKTLIKNFNDLISLNYDWWIYSKNSNEFWKSPDTIWLPFLIDMGLVKKIVETNIKYN